MDSTVISLLVLLVFALASFLGRWLRLHWQNKEQLRQQLARQVSETRQQRRARERREIGRR